MKCLNLRLSLLLLLLFTVKHLKRIDIIYHYIDSWSTTYKLANEPLAWILTKQEM